MLTLLLGTDWTQNREWILRCIADDVENRRENHILIVPELISHDTERRLAAAAGDTATRYAQVLSFTRLGRRVADAVGKANGECLDNSGRIVAMAAVARQLHSRLKTYAAVETKPEFLAQVIDAVDEFKRCCITPADLAAASRKTDGLLSQKLEELSLLMEGYDGLCANGKRDPRDEMTWVLEQLETIDFASRHVFYVDGFPDFTRQNLAILAHIIRSGAQITVSLNCDRVSSSVMAFEKAGQTARELEKIARQADIPVHIVSVSPRQDALAPMRETLFQGENVFRSEAAEAVRTVRAATVYQECQVAAQRIIELTQNGCRYRDIAVVCTQPESYLPTLQHIFDRCTIPLYMTGTEQVLRSGVISTVIFALNAALDGLEQRDVLRYLRSALSPLSQEACDRMENYAVIWAISGKRWSEEWTGHPNGLSDPWDDTARAELVQLNRDRLRVMRPLERLRADFANAGNVADQVTAIYTFLQSIDFCERLQDLAQEVAAAGDDRTAQIYNQLWEILLNALEQLYDVLGQTVWEKETFVRLLKLLLGQCDVGTIPPVLDAVNVGSVSAMRCGQQKHLVVLGAQEGLLPGYGGATGLLNDRERVTLRGIGVPLTGGAMEGLQAEFAEIYGVFCGAEESVLLTCSASQPSFVYKRLCVLNGGEMPADTTLTSELRNRASAGALLVRCADADDARRLGLEAEYQKIAARKDHRLGAVTAENIRALYGKRLRLSASQVDRQAECRLSYFLKYGLRARERKEARVDPAEFGTYVHAVLEQTGRAVMEAGGFHAVSLEQTLALAQRFSDEYAQTHFGVLDGQRMEYLFRRNVRELEMVVRELWRELSCAEYAPCRFELNFASDGEMPAVTIPNGKIDAELRGFVDRVDAWQRGESTYFRVVDYKTGKKTFDYCDVFNGVGLQMLIYLFALEKGGEQILPGKRVSAGVQYFPARVPYISVDGSMTDEQAHEQRRRERKRSGLLLADEQALHAMDPTREKDTLCARVKDDGAITGDVADRGQLGLLREYMMRILARMAEEIASGNIEPNPYTRGTVHDACTFCPYGTICHEQTVQGRRNYQKMSAEKFWEQVKKEVAEHG